MHCELVVPGLFAASADMRLPSIELLLARGRRTTTPAQNFEEWLRDAFHVEGWLPAGALTLLAGGGDPADGFWLRADPVHLHLLRDRVVLVAAEEFDLARAEADELCAALNRHFDGAMEVQVVDERRWVARLVGQQPELDEHPALTLSGRSVALKRSGDRELTEIQMVLHAHPVNEARESRGEPAVNSLWLWGGGRIPVAPQVPWHSVTANDPIALGLARLAGARHRTVPASADTWLDRSPEDGRHLVVLDSLRVPVALAREAEYRPGFEALERDWFLPLLAALRTGRIGMLTLHAIHGGACDSFEVIRGDLRRFWRRRKALVRYI